jgi:hypothetical protein
MAKKITIISTAHFFYTWSVAPIIVEDRTVPHIACNAGLCNVPDTRPEWIQKIVRNIGNQPVKN